MWWPSKGNIVLEKNSFSPHHEHHLLTHRIRHHGVHDVGPGDGGGGGEAAVAYEVGGDGEADGGVGGAALDGDAARGDLEEGEEAVDAGEHAREVEELDDDASRERLDKDDRTLQRGKQIAATISADMKERGRLRH